MGHHYGLHLYLLVLDEDLLSEAERRQGGTFPAFTVQLDLLIDRVLHIRNDDEYVCVLS
jgi:hypothetical protein